MTKIERDDDGMPVRLRIDGRRIQHQEPQTKAERERAAYEEAMRVKRAEG